MNHVLSAFFLFLELAVGRNYMAAISGNLKLSELAATDPMEVHPSPFHRKYYGNGTIVIVIRVVLRAFFACGVGWGGVVGWGETVSRCHVMMRHRFCPTSCRR